ncbi:MAG: hypothetical protein NTX71_03570 [Candidatus Aureabacteria bacterium]|nr:hypothetical protein [Candidatus Auribacterota bacterium]
MRFVLGAGIAIIVLLMALLGYNTVALIVCLILAIALALMYSLTVEIGDDALKVRYGHGLIRKTIPLSAIDSCRMVRYPWYFGWGLRWMPCGWLFRVSGLAAVELGMKNGRRYGIGSDEPEELERAIKAACGKG